MNNKSTENLIESSESIEELHVPPLDLKQLNDDKRKKSDFSDSDRSLNNRPKRVQNNFLVENESEVKSPINPPPIPAVRKLSLPPIASQRNGKDTKENSNQLTRKQSNDTIRIISERSTQQSKNSKVNSNDSESDSDIHQLKQSLHEKGNQIELKTFEAQTKNNLKSTFGVSEINEETTSFISYEEKHEKEDNSEHSSVNSKELPKYDDDGDEQGIKNEAFVQDPDDNMESERPSEIDSKSKSKKKIKKSKVVKKLKEKRKKQPLRHTGQTTEQAVVNESDDDIHPYDFKKVIGNENLLLKLNEKYLMNMNSIQLFCNVIFFI